MGCLEGSGVPVLYIGRTVRKGKQKKKNEILNGNVGLYATATNTL
jgi:hypothetical protein